MTSCLKEIVGRGDCQRGKPAPVPDSRRTLGVRPYVWLWKTPIIASDRLPPLTLHKSKLNGASPVGHSSRPPLSKPAAVQKIRTPGVHRSSSKDVDFGRLRTSAVYERPGEPQLLAPRKQLKTACRSSKPRRERQLHPTTAAFDPKRASVQSIISLQRQRRR